MRPHIWCRNGIWRASYGGREKRPFIISRSFRWLSERLKLRHDRHEQRMSQIRQQMGRE